jgi:hypothetical protein
VSSTATAPFLLWLGWCNGYEEAEMGTPTNTKKPKPKPGQPTGKDAAGKTAAQQKNGATPAPAKATNANVVVKPAAQPQRTQPPVPQTNKRDQKRETRREEITRKLEERRKEREAQLRRQRTKKWLGWGGAAAVALAIGAFIFYQIFLGPSVAAYLKGDTIAGIKCDVGEQGNTHFHTHLDLYVNGQPVQVDPNVGRQDPACFYWLHTHDVDGVIHVEAPSNGTYTVGQFFQIWGKPLSATNLMGNKVDATHQLTIYVYTPDNSTLQQDSQGNITVTPPSDLKPYTGDPAKIQLQPHELIVIEYGTPVVPPQPYTFIGGE